jgi:hypothetical protein
MDDALARASYLFEAYFHQDCLVDDPDWESIIERFKEAEPPESVKATRGALLQLLGRLDDAGINEFIFGPSCRSFYDPRPGGLTPRQWIEGMVHVLAGGSPRTSDLVSVSLARRQAAVIAREVLSGERDILLAARELAALRFSMDVPDSDPDFTCFVAIDSETDALPLGAVREHWSSEALQLKDVEIARSRNWAKSFGEAALQNLLRRFGDAG